MAKRKNQKSKSEGDKKVRVADEEEAARPPIPVSILSGFLGSGKTTLLRYILTSKEHGLKIAVIVNDMAELNVDGQTIARVTKTKREVVTLENGCICCTLRGDLIREINQIQKLQKFDYILIESTGIAEPQQVAESFCVDPETQALAPNPEQMLWNVARLDTCVTGKKERRNLIPVSIALFDLLYSTFSKLLFCTCVLTLDCLFICQY